MATPNSPNRMPKVADIVFKAQLIDDMQLKAALRAWDQWGGRFTKVLADLKFTNDEKVVHALAAALRLPPIDLGKVTPDSGALAKVDAATCQAKGIYPCILKDQGKTLWLAMADPTDYETVANLEQQKRVRIKLLVAGEGAIKKAVAFAYNLSGGVERSLTLETQVETTGEYMDASGEVVGPMKRSVTNPGSVPAPGARQSGAVNALPPRPQAAPKRPPPPPAAAAPAPQRTISDDLDHLFGVPKAQFTEDELRRLDELAQKQQLCVKMLHSIMELCVEKGFFVAEDINRIDL